MWIELIRAVAYFSCLFVCPDFVRAYLLGWFHTLCTLQFWLGTLQGAFVFLMVAAALGGTAIVRACGCAARLVRAVANACKVRSVVCSLAQTCMDPVSYDQIADPITLSCGHDLDRGTTYATLKALGGEGCVVCPMCRTLSRWDVRSHSLRGVLPEVVVLKTLVGVE